MNSRERLLCCLDVADEMRPVVVAFTDLDYPEESNIYYELMDSLAQRCEEYLHYYTSIVKENDR